jgi:L-alanine-DL-glutamate epimerase-like enolase superfamily enzyme
VRIKSVDVFHVDAGWRVWSFVKIGTTSGITGWSEVTDSHGSRLGIQGVITELTPLILQRRATRSEEIYHLLISRTRQSQGSIITKAISGIMNALLDIRAKHLGVPVYELFGGPLRQGIELYWSHCGTTRVRAWDKVGKPQIKNAAGVADLTREIEDSGYQTIKTNILVEDALGMYVYMPGFAKGGGGYERNPLSDKRVHIPCSDRFDTIIDLNYNFKTEGYVDFIDNLPADVSPLWIELDTPDAKACRYIRDRSPYPICSGENLYGLAGYKPFFDNYSMDICSIDILWNGFERSLDIAKLADLYEMSVTPHNYYSHLATFMAAQFCACVPNLRMMEYDVDDVPWREDLVSHTPQIHAGRMTMPTGVGWGTDINEDALHTRLLMQ